MGVEAEVVQKVEKIMQKRKADQKARKLMPKRRADLKARKPMPRRARILTRRKARKRKRRVPAVARVVAVVAASANQRKKTRKVVIAKMKSLNPPKMLHQRRIPRLLRQHLRQALTQQQLPQLHNPLKQVLQQRLERCGKALGTNSTKETTISRSAHLKQHGCFHQEQYWLREKMVHQ